MPGSAPECRRLLVLSHPRPWPARVEKLAVVEMLGPELKRLGAKLLLAHAPDGRARAIEWRDGVVRGDRFASAEEALAFLEGTSSRMQEELFLVCCHGSRDACCGQLGPPVARALELLGAEVLECSHPGGHRFAPTTLTFPEFGCYGNLTPDDVPAFLERQREGMFQPAHYRGALYLDKLCQVAEAGVWEETGSRPRVAGRDGLRVEAQGLVVQLEPIEFEGIPSCGDEPEAMLEHRVAGIFPGVLQ
ncbi:sucrase ferredoxin [bacterium CPR1]|nr:sucrase ferredoxin [bacterium CPR1]